MHGFIAEIYKTLCKSDDSYGGVAELKKILPKRIHKNTFWVDLGIVDKNTSRTEAVHQGYRPFVYKNIIEKAKLSQDEFHKATHIPVSTIKCKLKNNERFSTQESDAMYRLAALLKLAIDLFEDEKRALEWIRESVYGLDGNRPIDMVSTTVDFEIVKDLIYRIEHGVFS